MEDLNVDRVRAILHAKISGRGIDVDKVYINGVNNLQDRLVIYSETLVMAFLISLQNRTVPNFGGAQTGVFSQSHTFDDLYRFKGLSIEEINQLGEYIAKTFLA
jgi:hypothetical protein